MEHGLHEAAHSAQHTVEVAAVCEGQQRRDYRVVGALVGGDLIRMSRLKRKVGPAVLQWEARSQGNYARPEAQVVGADHAAGVACLVHATEVRCFSCSEGRHVSGVHGAGALPRCEDGPRACVYVIVAEQLLHRHGLRQRICYKAQRLCMGHAHTLYQPVRVCHGAALASIWLEAEALLLRETILGLSFISSPSPSLFVCFQQRLHSLDQPERDESRDTLAGGRRLVNAQALVRHADGSHLLGAVCCQVRQRHNPPRALNRLHDGLCNRARVVALPRSELGNTPQRLRQVWVLEERPGEGDAPPRPEHPLPLGVQRTPPLGEGDGRQGCALLGQSDGRGQQVCQGERGRAVLLRQVLPQRRRPRYRHAQT
mmetsp:Transcript_3983/g.9086  ORF Transcript_3983/g.9086 Transcript_3983/m.9086 type:complete len:370 (+) Transcript_3983:90-1199(+)